MKRSIVVAVAVLVTGGLLAGCAGAEAGVESASGSTEVGEVAQQRGSDQPADAAPRGFEFASGFWSSVTLTRTRWAMTSSIRVPKSPSRSLPRQVLSRCVTTTPMTLSATVSPRVSSGAQ